MDSKRQSKLPDGLGKKIVQALKTQNVAGQEMQEETFPMDQQIHMGAEDHGLETIPRMDFGEQEVIYDQPNDLSEFQELSINQETDAPNLETTIMSTDTPQYGSFVAQSQDLLMQNEPQTLKIPPQEVDYNQQSYEEFEYNQQSYDDFDYNQQSYEDFSEEPDNDIEEIPQYTQPRLGGPRPQMAPQVLPTQEPEFYQEDVDEFPNYTQEEYEEFSTMKQTQQGPDLDEFEDYSYQETAPQEIAQNQYQQTNEQTYDDFTVPTPQIGYSNQDILSEQSYIEKEPAGLGLDQQQILQEQTYTQQKPTPRSPLDLDSIGTEPTIPYQQEPAYSQPIQPEYNQVPSQPKDPLGEYHLTEEKHYQEPPRERYQPEDRRYQEPPRERYQPEERHYQEPPRERYQPEERHYQEPPRERYQPEDRRYQEPPRDYYQPEDRRYQEPPRDYYRPNDRCYQEPPRDYYQPEERRYQEPPRDRYHEPVSKHPEEIQRNEKIPTRHVEAFNSNVETLIKLVSTLPPGVTRQTGAQIIRQTMEAMGISMSEVLADAQHAQSRLHRHSKDNYNIIEEHKLLIRRLDEDIHHYQRKAKELDEIINLFILSDTRNR